jgi:hypothetical protein
MSSIFERTTKVMAMVGFTTFVIIPIESIRLSYVVTSTVPLLLFSGGEYILTGEQTYTNIWAYNIDENVHRIFTCVI